MRELRTIEKLILTVATTGAFQGKEANPNSPEYQRRLPNSL